MLCGPFVKLSTATLGWLWSGLSTVFGASAFENTAKVTNAPLGCRMMFEAALMNPNRA